MTAELTPGMKFEGRFLLERRLGSGGTGTVWLATDLGEGSRPKRAVKLLHPSFSPTGRTAGRFAREAEVLLALRHPNVVRAHEFSTGEHGAYLVMDYLEGETLAAKMQSVAERRQMIPLADVGVIFGQLCAAVQAAHEVGVIHRDLKPHNVIVFEARGELRLQVLDFGLAKLRATPDFDETTVGRMVGSYLYMSPEQAAGLPIDERVDVFALGSILFELLTLRRAWARHADGRMVAAFREAIDFDGPNSAPAIAERIARGDRPLPSEHRPGIPRGLDQVVARSLAISKDDRYPSVGVLHADFMRALVERSELSSAEPSNTEVSFTDPTPIQEHVFDARGRPRLASSIEVDVARARLPLAEVVPPIAVTAVRPPELTPESSTESTSGTLTLTQPIDPLPLPTPPRSRRWAVIAAVELVALAVAVAIAWPSISGAWRTAESSAPRSEERAAPAEVRAEPRPRVVAAERPREDVVATATATLAVPEHEAALHGGREEPSAAQRSSSKKSTSDLNVREVAKRTVEPRTGEPRTVEPRTADSRAGGQRAAPSAPRAAALAAKLAALKRAPADPAALSQLGREIEAEAEHIASPELRTRVKRLVFASVTGGDLAGLEECIRHVKAAEESAR